MITRRCQKIKNTKYKITPEVNKDNKSFQPRLPSKATLNDEPPDEQKSHRAQCPQLPTPDRRNERLERQMKLNFRSLRRRQTPQKKQKKITHALSHSLTSSVATSSWHPAWVYLYPDNAPFSEIPGLGHVCPFDTLIPPWYHVIPVYVSVMGLVPDTS